MELVHKTGDDVRLFEVEVIVWAENLERIKISRYGIFLTFVGMTEVNLQPCC